MQSYKYKSKEVIIQPKEALPFNWEELSIIKGKEAIQNFYPDNSLSQVIDNLDNAREAIQRMAKRSYQKMLESERGEELLLKANQYNISIPYEEDYINFLELIDLVDEYEELLTQAASYHIEWDISEYDPVGLSQEIENYEQSERQESSIDCHHYMMARV